MKLWNPAVQLVKSVNQNLFYLAQLVVTLGFATAAAVQHQVAELTRRKEIAGKLLNSRHRDLGDSRRLHQMLKSQSTAINRDNPINLGAGSH